jgi:predicted  nucleic acid-binding Zn-ribbon protein
MATPLKEELDKAMNDLRTLRDELRVKVNLASKDVKDTWGKLEPRLKDLEHRVESAADKTLQELKDTAHDLRARVKKLKDDL